MEVRSRPLDELTVTVVVDNETGALSIVVGYSYRLHAPEGTG